MKVSPAIKTAIRQAGTLLIAACLLAAISALLRPWQTSEEGVGEGEIALNSALDREPPPLWIDARSAVEFAEAHIPGALLLNEEEWTALLPPVLQRWDPGQASVVYCDSPGCEASREVAERLREIKLGPVFILKGGWKTWKRN